MMLQTQLDKAIVLATKTHSGDYDKAGKPYIQHVIRVAMNVDKVRKYPVFSHYSDEMVEKVRIVCFLHDTVEDSINKVNPITFNVLRDMGFDEDIVKGVDGMTKREGETYKEAIQRALQHPLSHMGKVCDITDNMDLERLKHCDVKTREAGLKRVENRYKPAMKTLLHEASGFLRLLEELNGKDKLRLLTDEQIELFIERYSADTLNLTTKQAKAVRMALTSNVSILDGAAGTGVISTLKSIIDAVKRHCDRDANIHLFTATGKSRKVLSERTGLEVKLPTQNHGLITGDLLIINDPQLITKSVLTDLLRQAHGIRILFITDLLMLGIVEGIDFNAIVKSRIIPKIRLTEIMRQK